MRNARALMLGSLVATAICTAGCKDAAADGSTGASEARLVVSALGTDTATLHVTAIEDASVTVAFDRIIEVEGGHSTVIPLVMTPSRYTFVVDVNGSGEQAGHASANVTMKNGETAQITLTVRADNPSQTKINVDAAPRIDAVDVTLKGGLGNNQRAEIHVVATDADSDSLSYFWSGAGLARAMEGGSTITIPAAIAAAAPATIHVVVQDPEGATAQANIAINILGTEVHTTTTPGGHEVGSCQEAHAQCKAACVPEHGDGVSMDASCASQCGLALAECVGR